MSRSFAVMLQIAVSSFVRTKMTNPFLGLLVFSVLLEVRGEIRCYCNLPVCVSTGYMCKSSQDTCFTEHFAFSSELSQSRHGCSELLHQHHKHHQQRVDSPHHPCAGRMQRRRSNDVLPPSSPPLHPLPAHPLNPKMTAVESQPEAWTNEDIFPSLFCCQEDMCNYVNAMDIHVQIQAKSNHTHRGIMYNGGDKSGFPGSGSASDGSAAFGNQDLWFKAAVIAVPIAGSFVLVLLILLAAHMLKQDSRRQRRLSELRRQRMYKARLLLGEAYGEKGIGEHPFSYAGHDGDAMGGGGGGGNAYVTAYLVNNAKSGDSNYQDFVYERPVSVSLCGSFLPLTRWDSNYKSPTFV